MNFFNYGIDQLTTSKALEIARGERLGILNEEAKAKIENSAAQVQQIVAGDSTVYGINTGFGPLCNVKISPEDTRELQYNILKSHSVGVGNPIAKEIAKLMMILKVHSLAKGFSGIQMPTLERICWHIDNEIIPIVPEKGSVGASGDLAPLAHLFLPLIGLGQVMVNDKVYETATYFEKNKIEPIELGPKEGLALINGTQFIAAHAIKVVDELHSCLQHADLIGAMMLEALLGSMKPFKKELHEIRPFKGNIHVAQNMRSLLSGSEILTSHLNCTESKIHIV